METVTPVQSAISIGSPSASACVASDISYGLAISISPNLHNISTSPPCELSKSMQQAENRAPVVRRKDSPSSPQQWKASLESLSADLSRICRKPTGLSEQMSPRYASKAPVFQSFDSPYSQSRPASIELTNTRSSPGGGDSPTSHGAANMIGGYQPADSVNRPIRVRHEETEFRLKQSLTAICGVIGQPGSRPGSNVSTEPAAEVDGKNSASFSVARDGRVGVLSGRRSGNALMCGGRDTKKSPQLQLKESLKSGVRLKLDLEALGGLENITVCASGSEHCVKVYSGCSGGSSVGGAVSDSVHVQSKSVSAAQPSLSSSSQSGEAPCKVDEAVSKVVAQGPVQSLLEGGRVEGSDEAEGHGMRLVSTGVLLETCSISVLTATVVGSVLYVRERPKSALLNYTGTNAGCCGSGFQKCGSGVQVCPNGLDSSGDGSQICGDVAKLCGSGSQTCSGDVQIPGNSFSEVSSAGPKAPSSGPRACVPLIYEDEAAMKFTIVLHVASEYYRRPAGPCTGLLVKTVDDSLIIRGQGLADDLSSGVTVVEESLKLLEETGRSRFSVAMKLPEGSVSRTVTAELSPIGQLIIRGRLSPASRRMTCDF